MGDIRHVARWEFLKLFTVLTDVLNTPMKMATPMDHPAHRISKRKLT